jgi:Ca2+-binding EF-hand superfamily protein
VAKIVHAGVAVLCSALASSGCSRGGPGGQFEIGTDEAASALALEAGEDGSRVDFADAVSDPPALARDCQFSELRERVTTRYDRDDDGELDAAELAALRRDFGGHVARDRAQRVARLERERWLRWVYDANADRKLDLDEWRALKHDLDARCQNHQHELVQRYDRNHDGRLDDVEWAEARADLATRYAEQHARVLAAFDTNHDGRLSTRERAAAEERMRQRIDARWEMLVDRFDANRDGILTPRERAALREYARSTIRDERTIALPPDRTARRWPSETEDAGSELQSRGG